MSTLSPVTHNKNDNWVVVCANVMFGHVVAIFTQNLGTTLAGAGIAGCFTGFLYSEIYNAMLALVYVTLLCVCFQIAESTSTPPNRRTALQKRCKVTGWAGLILPLIGAAFGYTNMCMRIGNPSWFESAVKWVFSATEPGSVKACRHSNPVFQIILGAYGSCQSLEGLFTAVVQVMQAVVFLELASYCRTFTRRQRAYAGDNI